MIQVPDFIQRQLSSQLVGGGLMLMFTGSLIALARRVPSQAYGWVKSRFTRTVTIENTDPLFDYVTYWLNSQERFRRSRFLRATTELRLNGSSKGMECSSPGSYAPKKLAMEVFFSPSAGRHFFKYSGVWISVARSSNDNKPASSSGSDNSSAHSFRKEESYLIESFGGDDGTASRALIQEIVEFGTEETDGVRIYSSTWGHWNSSGYQRMRSLSTVVLPAGDAELVVEDMREFRSLERWYRDLGIPWHKGYLLHGLPGSGKTSLAAAAAGELDMDIYLLNLSGTGMNDETLQRLMGDVRPGCMVILEDIDCTAPDRDAASGNKVTLSGLLNCLDGIMSREGCIIVMTTNYRANLDAALVRPGRVDFELEFSYATWEQIERFAKRLDVDPHGLGARPMTMAEVQKELLDRYWVEKKKVAA